MITMKEVMDALLLPPTIFKDIALIALVLSVIQISPLKLDPWVWIKEFIALPKRMNALETDYQNDKAYRWRSMILSRSDRIRRGEKFSEERWNDTIDTIDRYKKYCDEMERKNDRTFINGKATAAIEYLEHKYTEVLEKCDFLR